MNHDASPAVLASAPGSRRRRPRRPVRAGRCLAVLLAVAATGSLPTSVARAAPLLPTFRADTDRDGLITAADDARKDEWSRERGALMLPNVDDDQERCPTAGSDGSRLSDDSLAACNDAADDVVNGKDDLADLAPVRLGAEPRLDPPPRSPPTPSPATTSGSSPSEAAAWSL